MSRRHEVRPGARRSLGAGVPGTRLEQMCRSRLIDDTEMPPASMRCGHDDGPALAMFAREVREGSF